MNSTRISCEVFFTTDADKVGEYANAIRIVRDAGDDCFIDFCAYSAQENIARVVSRVRVQSAFLPQIVERVAEHQLEIENAIVLSTHRVDN